MGSGRKYWTVLLLGLVITLGIMRFINARRGASACVFTDRKDPSELIYVNHARCRMTCRDISREMVEEIYLKGKVNCKKSFEKNGDMRYALEMKDLQGDKIRVVIEDEDGKHIVITAIRLGGTDRCECS